MSELYAGKIILKPTAMARLRIRDRYSLHRMVLDLYPCRETDGKGPFALNSRRLTLNLSRRRDNAQ